MKLPCFWLDAFLKAKQAKWAKMVKDSGVKLD